MSGWGWWGNDLEPRICRLLDRLDGGTRSRRRRSVERPLRASSLCDVTEALGRSPPRRLDRLDAVDAGMSCTATTVTRRRGVKTVKYTSCLPGRGHRSLGEVAVRVRHLGVALEVLAVDEGLDAALDDLRVRAEEGELREHLGQ